MSEWAGEGRPGRHGPHRSHSRRAAGEEHGGAAPARHEDVAQLLVQLEEVPVVGAVVGLRILLHARQQPPSHSGLERRPPLRGQQGHGCDEEADHSSDECGRRLHPDRKRSRVGLGGVVVQLRANLHVLEGMNVRQAFVSFVSRDPGDCRRTVVDEQLTEWGCGEEWGVFLIRSVSRAQAALTTTIFRSVQFTCTCDDECYRCPPNASI